MTKRSAQQSASGRRPARISRIGRLAVAAEVLEYPFNERGFLGAGDHLELPAAAPAGLDVDGKDTLEPLCPSQGPLPVGARRLAGRRGIPGRASGRRGG